MPILRGDAVDTPNAPSLGHTHTHHTHTPHHTPHTHTTHHTHTHTHTTHHTPHTHTHTTHTHTPRTHTILCFLQHVNFHFNSTQIKFITNLHYVRSPAILRNLMGLM